MQMVWRVQNERGIGPYYHSSGKPQYPYAYAHYNKDPNIQPDLWQDFPHDWRLGEFRGEDTWLFAFPTKRAAEAWFGAENLAALASLGWRLVRVPASRTKRSISGKQVAFVPLPDHPAHRALELS